jgi:ABC-type dipeptide/oligopeptide/nickel transport system ATPase subunit
MPTLIEARDLTKKYGRHTALDHATFRIGSGRIVGLIGPNGAGKTSALRAILGLTSYAGHLRVLDREPFAERASLMRDACFIADDGSRPTSPMSACCRHGCESTMPSTSWRAFIPASGGSGRSRCWPRPR